MFIKNAIYDHVSHRYIIIIATVVIVDVSSFAKENLV